MSTKQRRSDEQWATRDSGGKPLKVPLDKPLNMRLPGITPSPCGGEPASAWRYDMASVYTYITTFPKSSK